MLDFHRESRDVAEHHPLGAVSLIGDYGGFTYVIRKASDVAATDDALRQLAIDLDAAFELHLAHATDIWWGIVNPWEEWGGTPPVSEGFWVHPRLLEGGIHPASVDAVLMGTTPRLLRAG